MKGLGKWREREKGREGKTVPLSSSRAPVSLRGNPQQLCSGAGVPGQQDCPWMSECPDLRLPRTVTEEWSRVFLDHPEVNSQRQHKVQVVQLE